MIIVKIKGGLGNQLFQYATAKNLALKLRTELYFDLSFFEKEKYKGIFRLNYYNIDIKIVPEEIRKRYSVDNNHLCLISIIKKLYRYLYIDYVHENQVIGLLTKYDSIKKTLYLDDWFANPILFKEIEKILLPEIRLNEISQDTMTLGNTISKSNSVALHFRRGDYLTNNFFYNLSDSYYRKAINYLKSALKDPVFYFFSDDMEYVKDKFQDIKKAVFSDRNNEKQGYYNTKRDVEDLYLMSLCNHQVIANSTYSWWGAWLNTNPKKIVIAPKIWYNDSTAQKAYKEGTLIPKEWIKL